MIPVTHHQLPGVLPLDLLPTTFYSEAWKSFTELTRGLWEHTRVSRKTPEGEVPHGTRWMCQLGQGCLCSTLLYA